MVDDDDVDDAWLLLDISGLNAIFLFHLLKAWVTSVEMFCYFFIWHRKNLEDKKKKRGKERVDVNGGFLPVIAALSCLSNNMQHVLHCQSKRD